MSRIISGLAGSIRLASAPAGTRPTSDRVKESVFASLEAVGAIENADVLDLFAGTGALGLEALSRGAKSLVAVESARAALNVCLKNSASVGTALSAAGAQPPMEIKLSDAVAYLASTIKEFDLVFADPPYDLDVAGKLLERVGAVLRPNGLFVLELSSKTENPALVEGIELSSEKAYGDTKVLIFRLTAQ